MAFETSRRDTPIQEVNAAIRAAINDVQVFLLDGERNRYLFPHVEQEMKKYFGKIEQVLLTVELESSFSHYHDYLQKLSQSIEGIKTVLNRWRNIVINSNESENKQQELYGIYLEDLRKCYKIIKRKVQSLEDLNAKIERNKHKASNFDKRSLLMIDGIEKIQQNKLKSLKDPQDITDGQIVKQFAELFLDPNILSILDDAKQIPLIQKLLLKKIQEAQCFEIHEYFKILVGGVAEQWRFTAYKKYASLLQQALHPDQHTIKGLEIAKCADQYIAIIEKQLSNPTVVNHVLDVRADSKDSLGLYVAAKSITVSLAQLLIYMSQEQLQKFISSHQALFFDTEQGLDVFMVAWLNVYAIAKKQEVKNLVGANILSACNTLCSSEDERSKTLLYSYVQTLGVEQIQTLSQILAIQNKDISLIDFKVPKDIKYFFMPGFSRAFVAKHNLLCVEKGLLREWQTAWFYINAHDAQYSQSQEIINYDERNVVEMAETFAAIREVAPFVNQFITEIFSRIAGFGSKEDRIKLWQAVADQVGHSDDFLLQARSAFAPAVMKLTTLKQEPAIFSQLSAKCLLHFCSSDDVDKLLEINPSLQPYRDILQFPLQENFDLLYYFSDQLITMEDKLAFGDGVWAMKLIYHVFTNIDTAADDVSHYAEFVNDLLDSVQRFSQFYHRSAVDMPSRVLQGFDDFYLWQLEMPSEYATNSPLSFGQVICAIQGNEIDYKLLDVYGKVLNGKLQATELGIQLPANAELSDLMRAKEDILAAIASKESDLGWQALLIKQYLRLKDTVLEQILAGFSSMSDTPAVSLADKIRDTILIIDGARNYKFSIIDSVVNKYLDEGLTCAGIEQDITLFFDAMVSAIAKALARQDKTLTDWSYAAHSVDDRIKFICARKKYSESQFKAWFLDMNTGLAADKNTALMGEYLPRVRNLNETQQTLFTSLGIDFLQYNQEIAIASVYQHLANVKDNGGKINLFMKLGTGQGKSLVIAESARKILAEKIANKVMIFTCYDHLAERDFNKFQSYFEHFGYKAAVILPTDLDPVLGIAHTTRSHRLTGLSDVQIVYVNLETYIALLRQERAKRIKGQNTQVVFPDVRDSVAIMDEFDSLVLDSDEIGQILDRFIVPSANLLALGKSAAERKLLADLDSTGIVKSLLRTATGIDAWQSWYNRQWDQLVAGGRRFSDVSSLGKSNHFKSALLDEYSFGRVTLLGSVIDPLTFYNSFKFVIGLSGSITKQTHQLTTKVLTGASNYLEIPPFFGPINAEKNRLQTKELICDSQTQHVQRIVDEAILAHQTERPVLIFAESVKKSSDNQSDFEALKSALRACDSLSDNKLLFIESEFDIKRHLPSIGKRKYVTLATRILARGADIKVDTEVPEGLHLVVGYYPDRESIYIQMLGRTARQDDKGSYAVITRSKADFKPLNSSTDVVDGICHQVSEAVFNDEKLPQAEQTGRQHLQAFPLFLTALRASSSATLQGKERTIESAATRAFPRLRH